MIERLGRAFSPEGGNRIHSDVVPHDAPAIVLSHGFREQTSFVPELGSAEIGNPL
jgi:hypothetical protein